MASSDPNNPIQSQIESPIQLLAQWIDPIELCRRWRFLALCTVASLGMGVMYLLCAAPHFQIESRVWIEQRGTPLDQRAVPDRNTQFLPTQAEIMRSPAVIRRVVEKMELSPLLPKDKAVFVTQQQLSVDPLIGTNVLSVRFHDSDPQRGIQIVDLILGAYQEYMHEKERESNSDRLNLLAKREKDLRDGIQTLQKELASIREQSPLLGQGREAIEVQKSLITELGRTLTETKSRRWQLENTLHALYYPSNDDADNIVNAFGNGDSVAVSIPTTSEEVVSQARLLQRRRTMDVIVTMLNAGWTGLEDPNPVQQAHAEAEILMKELSARFGPQHPNIIAAQRRLNALELRLQSMIDDAPRVLESQLDTLRLYESSLKESYDRHYQEAKSLDHFVIRESQLQEELNSTHAQHDIVLTQLKNSQLVDQASLGGPLGVWVEVLEEPAVANFPLSASKSVVLGLAGFLGLLAGICILAGKDNLNQLMSLVTSRR